MTADTTTPVQLTDAQLAQFTACGIIVVEGDKPLGELGRSEYYKVIPQPVAPELWRKLTEPCATCDGSGERWSYPGSGPPTYRGPCADCVGGRSVVVLTSTCGWCDGSRYTVQGAHNYLDTCGRCDGEGVVELGRFTVRLLPVVGDGHIVPGEDYIEAVDGGEVILWTACPDDDEGHASTFLFDAPDNQPQPGQWAVVFEAVAP